MNQQHLQSIAREMQAGVLRDWPKPGRIYVDAWCALEAWHRAGEFVFRLRDKYPPPLPPDLAMATAPLKREACCYISRGSKRDESWWLTLARIGAETNVGREGHVIRHTRPPILCYATEFADGSLGSGHISLVDQPTPRALKLFPGNNYADEGTRKMESDEVATEGVRLAQCLPWFFAK